MVKSINAFRIVFNTLLSLVELLIGMRFLLNLFGSNESADELLRTVSLVMEQMGFFTSGMFAGSGLEKPVAALFLLLGFMFFCFIMITIVPVMVERKEKQLDLEFADDDFF